MNNITLIGLPTAGKSKLSNYLMEKEKYSRIDGDSDILIPRIGNLHEFISRYGEYVFLALEERLFLNYDFKKSNQVISPGGSIVYSDLAMEKLSRISTVFYLYIPYKHFLTKEEKLRERGVIGFGSKTLKELYDERDALCRKYADFKFDFSKREYSLAVKKIFSKI